MSLVKIFGNTYLNPSCVGKVELIPSFVDGKSRTNTTTVYDVTGQYVLFQLVTTVLTPAPDNDVNAVNRDNHAHSEIIKAISDGRDATSYKFED